MKKSFVIGSRGSELALRQTGTIKKALDRLFPRLRFRVQIVKTLGDRDKSLSVFDHKDTGIFTRAIEKKLLSEDIDIAVHSLKDLPTALPKGLAIGACVRREDPRDCLVTKKGIPLSKLPQKASVGTASPRRARQLLIARPDLDLRAIRGNLGTRIAHVTAGRLDAIVIAEAGIQRLGHHAKLTCALDLKQSLPCVGQGILALEIRSTDTEVLRIVSKLDHTPSRQAADAERSLLSELRGGCRVPLGAFARIQKGRLKLDAVVLSVRSKNALRGSVTGRPADATAIGRKLAKKLLKKGAGRLLLEARG